VTATDGDRPSQADTPMVNAAEQDPSDAAAEPTVESVPPAPAGPNDPPVEPDGPVNPA
jgi:hypothetical protein